MYMLVETDYWTKLDAYFHVHVCIAYDDPSWLWSHTV